MKIFEKLMRRFGYIKLSKHNKYESFDNDLEVYDDNVQVNILYKNPYEAIQSLKAGEMHSLIFDFTFNEKKRILNMLDMMENNNEEIDVYDIVDIIFGKFNTRIEDLRLTDIMY